MNKAKKRIHVLGTICRVLSIVMLVLMIISTAGLVTAGVALIVMPKDTAQISLSGSVEAQISGRIIDMIPDDVLDSISEQIEDGSLSVNINGEAIQGAQVSGGSLILNGSGKSASFDLRRVGIALIAYSLTTGCLIYVFIMCGRLMNEIRVCDSPFSEGVVKSLKQFAISLIPYAVIRSTATSFANNLLTTGSYSFDFKADTELYFAALIIVMLVFIFNYGAALQKDADETL